MINPIFAVTAILGILLQLLPTRSEDTERRLFWAGVLITAVSGFFALYPPDAERCAAPRAAITVKPDSCQPWLNYRRRKCNAPPGC